jgi:Enolase C-terminal domain-like
VWNGVWQSMKIATAADAFEVNIAPHNFYGHLCTMMNAHFAAAAPNLSIMEVDIDRLAWDHELFTVLPQFEDGHLLVPDTPGWAPSQTRKRSLLTRLSRAAACCITVNHEDERRWALADVGDDRDVAIAKCRKRQRQRSSRICEVRHSRMAWLAGCRSAALPGRAPLC